MKNDEKKCPLTKMTCYGEECAWWCLTECGVAKLPRAISVVSNELFHTRTEVNFIRKEMESGL